MTVHPMTKPATAKAAQALLEQFRWRVDPSVDPLGVKIRESFDDQCRSKGGCSVEEARVAFDEAVLRDPHSWPVPPCRLEALWQDATDALDDPPQLARPAQLVWRGLEAGYDQEIIDAALATEFPGISRLDMAKAYREWTAHRRRAIAFGQTPDQRAGLGPINRVVVRLHAALWRHIPGENEGDDPTNMADALQILARFVAQNVAPSPYAAHASVALAAFQEHLTQEVEWQLQALRDCQDEDDDEEGDDEDIVF